jgi:hypothetical protein
MVGVSGRRSRLRGQTRVRAPYRRLATGRDKQYFRLMSDMSPRRRLYELPVDALFNHPGYVALPAAGRGMLLSVLEYHWRSGCRPLPPSQDELFSVARAHRSTWSVHKSAILQIFADIQAELEAYHRRRAGAAKGLKIAARNGGAANAARIRLRALEQSSPPHPTTSPIPTRAATPPGWSKPSGPSSGDHKRVWMRDR